MIPEPLTPDRCKNCRTFPRTFTTCINGDYYQIVFCPYCHTSIAGPDDGTDKAIRDWNEAQKGGER